MCRAYPTNATTRTPASRVLGIPGKGSAVACRQLAPPLGREQISPGAHRGVVPRLVVRGRVWLEPVQGCGSASCSGASGEIRGSGDARGALLPCWRKLCRAMTPVRRCIARPWRAGPRLRGCRSRRLLDGDVGHETVGGGAVPVVLAWFEVDAVAGVDLFAAGRASAGRSSRTGRILPGLRRRPRHAPSSTTSPGVMSRSTPPGTDVTFARCVGRPRPAIVLTAR